MIIVKDVTRIVSSLAHWTHQLYLHISWFLIMTFNTILLWFDIASTEGKINQFNSTASCSHLVLIITLIFVWILSVKDVTWICFRRTFCNIFLDISGFWDGIWYIFVFDLICLFQWIVFICYVVSSLPHCGHTIGSQNLTFFRFT